MEDSPSLASSSGSWTIVQRNSLGGWRRDWVEREGDLNALVYIGIHCSAGDVSGGWRVKDIERWRKIRQLMGNN